MNKVSVISTVYNGSKYIPRIIPAILNQTFSEFEYVIVDDGSGDRFGNLIREWLALDDRIKFFSPGRLGRARALNFAVQHSSGEYIIQQDFDDMSYSDRIEKQFSFLESHPDIGVVGGYFKLINEIGNETYIRMPPLEHHLILRSMTKGVPFAHTLVAFRKKAWEDAGGYPDIDDIIDLNLWISMAQKGWKMANIPSVLGEHRVYEDSFWHSNFKYITRQVHLVKAEARAIRELALPKRYYCYPIARLFCSHLPSRCKKIIRRKVLKMQEIDCDVSK